MFYISSERQKQEALFNYKFRGLQVVPGVKNLFLRVHVSKDGRSITQRDTQPNQTCSGGFIKTQPYAICCCFFAIGEYNLI